MIRKKQFNTLINKITPNKWTPILEQTCAAAFSNHTNSKEKNTTIRNIVTSIKEDGFVLIPHALDGKVLEKLQEEFDQILANEKESAYQVDRHDGAICVRVKPLCSLSKLKYPATHAFYSSQLLLDITKSFYENETGRLDFNNEVFIHRTPETNDPLSGAFHWDRKQTLKFWVYINDVPIQAGPMRVAKGTSAQNRLERIAKSTEGPLKGGQDNLVAIDSTHTVVDLAGPAGTLLVHDSDSVHGAGIVQHGYTRKIMRGHCRMIQDSGK